MGLNFYNFTFIAYSKIRTSIEKEPLSTKSPKNKYLVVSKLPPTSKIFNKS